MSDHEFRNPDKFQQQSHRDYMRHRLPSGPRGCVLQDLDLLCRVYGPEYKDGEYGRFMLAEMKYGDTKMKTAQRMTFGLLDSLLHIADVERKFYQGFFVINYYDDDWEKSSFKVNGIELDRDTFDKFLQVDREILAMIREEAPIFGNDQRNIIHKEISQLLKNKRS